MKIATLLIVFNLLSILPQGEETKLQSDISDVTVYTSSASITRVTESISISTANTILILSELSPYIDQNSIQVKLKGSGVINSVKFRKNYLTTDEVIEQVKEFESQCLAQKDTLADLELRLKTLDLREDFLMTNKAIKGEQAVLTLQNLKEIDNYYSEQCYQIFAARSRLTEQKAELHKTSNALRRQIIELSPKGEDIPLDLIVNVSPNGSGNVSLMVTYQVRNAGWYTTYDMRADDIQSPVQLVQKANVYQNTGVDWKDVSLSFSNENVENSKAMPELHPMYLPQQSGRGQAHHNSRTRSPIATVHGYVYDRGAKESLPFANVHIEGTALATTTDYDGYYELAVPPGYGNVISAQFIGYKEDKVQVNQARIDLYLQESGELLDEVVVTGYDIKKLPSKNISALAATTSGLSTVNGSDTSVRGSRSNSTDIYIDGVRVNAGRGKTKYEAAVPSSRVDETELNFKFSLDDPYTINSDGKNNEIGLRSIEMEADFTYRAIPKISQSVYLTGYIDEWEDKNLTMGNMNLYFEGGYIGQSLLNPHQLQDSMVLSLGVDSKIQIERKREKSYSKKVSLNTKECTEVQYAITVKNQKSTPITLEIWDQIPVSTLKEIEVTSKDITSGFDLDKLRGIGNWKQTVEAKGEAILKIGYEVKYPKRFNFIL